VEVLKDLSSWVAELAAAGPSCLGWFLVSIQGEVVVQENCLHD
jgi:hypothetical protein